MFIFNVKLNSNKLFKAILILMIILALILLIFCITKIFSSKTFFVNDTAKSDIVEIDADTYTNFLKSTHEDIDSYVGMKIRSSGYIYKLIDFEDTQFVLARDMLIFSNEQDAQYVVVGFLCEYDKIANFEDNSWIEIEGEITKGTYHNSDIPIVKITNCKSIPTPKNAFVFPPDDFYVPTSYMF